MKGHMDYIQVWLHGEETTSTTQPISARVKNETVAHLEQLMSTFSISKTEAIQGALDTGLKELLHEADRIFVEKPSNEDRFIQEEARTEHEEARRDFEDSLEDK